MTYADLLAAAQSNPAEADFHSLRMAYTRSPGYAPYENDLESVEALDAALRANNIPAALEAIFTLLDTNYLDVEAHIAADYVYTRLGETQESTYHRAFAKGLIGAVAETGDGQSLETSFIVISVPEEYTLLRVLGLKPSHQSLIQQDGHWFDVFDVQNPVSGTVIKVYFNIDLPRSWLDQHMPDHDNSSTEPGSSQ